MDAPSSETAYRLFLAVAMCRSGHNAINAWLYRNAPAPKMHVNGVTFGASLMLKYTCEIDFRERDPFRGHGFIFYDEADDATFPATRASAQKPTDAQRLEHQRRVRQGAVRTLTLDLEDYTMADPDIAAAFCRAETIGRPSAVVSLLILRDPFNLFASRVRGRAFSDEESLPHDIGLYLRYLDEYTGATNRLPNKVCVNYNRWAVDPGYREELLARLGLPVRDNSIGYVPFLGGGSSFRGLEGPAPGQSVFDRYLAMRGDPLMQAVLDSPPLRRAAEDQFGLRV